LTAGSLAAQTPQAYQYPLIKNAMEKAKNDAFKH
jgi:2-C-methyl-D-erythritol 4-phosphate cytidylyltransferase